MDNYVISSGTAIVNGKITGLAGCTTKECPRINCIRRDEGLTYRVPHGGDYFVSCKVFISTSTQ